MIDHKDPYEDGHDTEDDGQVRQKLCQSAAIIHVAKTEIG